MQQATPQISASLSKDARTWVDAVEKDGFVAMRGMLDPVRVMEVRKELAAVLELDLAERAALNVTSYESTKGSFYSTAKKDEHTVVFPMWRSPGLQELLAQVLDHPDMVEFLKRIVGENYRIRLDLVRRSTGVNDVVDSAQVPREWHIDAPGEFTFGIFFDDLTRINSGGTTFIPGTHKSPYDPRFDFLVGDTAFTSQEFYLKGEALAIPRILAKACLVNRYLIKPVFAQRAVELTGAPGDVYFFLNEAWHGRAPNVHGGQNIMVRVGCFATDFPFKEDFLPREDPSALLPSIARRYVAGQPVNRDPTTLLQRMKAREKPIDRFYAASIEKQAANHIVEWAYPLALKIFGSRENLRRFAGR